MRILAVVPLLLLGVGCSGKVDPLEDVNSVTYALNDGLDKFLLKPASDVWKAAVPKPVRGGIDNAFGNLGYLNVIANDLLQGRFDVLPWTVGPHSLAGLAGVLTAPLLHGSPEHLMANAMALLVLVTLAGTVYPRATSRAIPLAWLRAGLAAWLLGEPGSHHLGASGVAQGLAYLVVVLAMLRRDRTSVAAAMIAFTFSGGLLVAVLPHDPTVSWQSHLGGAIGGIVAACLFRRSDPAAPRQRYSWELEDDADEDVRSSR
jgi:membrane associated rhomboid family serine protease